MSDVSRRSFLRAATLTLAVAAIPVARPGEALAAPRAGTRPGTGERRTPAAPALTRTSFVPHLHGSFLMVGPAEAADRRAVRVVLAEIGDLRGATPGDDHRFSLLFSVPRKLRTTQGVHQFERAAFGRAALFAVPVDRGRSARFYQVVVNRPV